MEKEHKRRLISPPKSSRSEDLLVSLKSEGGHLHGLLEEVLNRRDLTLQIRDNYFNVYYMGGNVAKVNSSKSVELDENYFRTKRKQEKDLSDTDSAKHEKGEAIDLFKKGKFHEYLNLVISKMKNYWTIEPKGVEEKKAQHKICLENEYLKSDFTILDLEYQVSTESHFCYRGKRKTDNGNIPSPRYDIVAIHNADSHLCVIELKKGVGALDGHSGLQEHAESFINSIGFNENTGKEFIKEMSLVLKQKQELGLVDQRLSINENLSPEFIFAYQYDPKDTEHKGQEVQKNIFKHYQYKPYKGFDFASEAKVILLDDNDYKLSEPINL